MDPTGARVLIVDDDRDINLMLSALMQREGIANRGRL